MKFITNRLLRRFGPARRLADAALVGGAALKYAQRRGWVNEETAKKFGASTSESGSTKLSITEIMLNGAGPVIVEKDGRLVRSSVSLDLPTIERMIEATVAGHGRQVDRCLSYRSPACMPLWSTTLTLCGSLRVGILMKTSLYA